jgi:hypothetical protein
LRKRLEWFARGNMIQDFNETLRLIHETKIAFKGIDIEWAELCHKLGRRDLLHKPIRLAPTPAERRALSQQSTVRKSIAPMLSFRTGADWLRYCRETGR